MGMSDSGDNRETTGYVPPYYNVSIGGAVADMYAIATAHRITHPAICHALKYLLRAGKKAGETERDAVQKAIDALSRYMDMTDHRNGRQE